MVDSGETSGDVAVLITGRDAEAKPRYVWHITANKIGPVLRLFPNNGRYGKSSSLFYLFFLRKTMMLQ